jgi:hypothetical protein
MTLLIIFLCVSDIVIKETYSYRTFNLFSHLLLLSLILLNNFSKLTTFYSCSELYPPYQTISLIHGFTNSFFVSLYDVLGAHGFKQGFVFFASNISD